MKHLVFRLSAILAAAASLSCSSLLKLSVDTGKPLPEEDLSARVQTRGFYSEMSNIAVAAADTIAAHAPCDEIRIRALRWKIRFTRAAVTAVMQSIPEVAVADTWILCRTIDETFAAMPDSLLFGPLSPLARKAADSLHRRAEALARGAFNDKRYRRLERFVDICMTSLPEQGSRFVEPEHHFRMARLSENLRRKTRLYLRHHSRGDGRHERQDKRCGRADGEQSRLVGRDNGSSVAAGFAARQSEKAASIR
ncbi:MAG: hypothetical protein L6V35_04815 [Alistipes putredinis]|nr:MAG: hypothetical protein L6V35_04815 [Alistipes putredinis]